MVGLGADAVAEDLRERFGAGQEDPPAVPVPRAPGGLGPGGDGREREERDGRQGPAQNPTAIPNVTAFVEPSSTVGSISGPSTASFRS